MELPAGELQFWMAYYSIYPFPQDREDFRMAQICEMLNTMAQGKFFKGRMFKDFLPNYLGDTVSTQKSLEQQIAEEKAYVDLAIAAGFAVMEKK